MKGHMVQTLHADALSATVVLCWPTSVPDLTWQGLLLADSHCWVSICPGLCIAVHPTLQLTCGV